MQINLLILLILPISLYSQQDYRDLKVGEPIPDYTFNKILSAKTGHKTFGLNNQKKPIVIEFWATWCGPCIDAMSKLEELQDKFTNEIEIITVSSDSKKNLNRYIQNTNTRLRIAFDTVHQDIFKYKKNEFLWYLWEGINSRHSHLLGEKQVGLYNTF